MKQNVYQKAEYLLSELGAIEDRFLQEALEWSPARRRSPRAFLIAACVALLVLAVPLSVVISKQAEKNEMDNVPPVSDAATASIDEILAASTKHETISDVQKLDLQVPSLVWQTDSDDALHVRILNDTELARLSNSMKKDGTAVGDSSPMRTHRLWIVYGDGTVRTPYLKSSSGNLSTELFDYEIECLPTDAFTDCLADILNE